MPVAATLTAGGGAGVRSIALADVVSTRLPRVLGAKAPVATLGEVGILQVSSSVRTVTRNGSLREELRGKGSRIEGLRDESRYNLLAE